MTDAEKFIKRIRTDKYKGCRNCKYQIAPLRRCRWAEEDKDNPVFYLQCPMWEIKADKEKEE